MSIESGRNLDLSLGLNRQGGLGLRTAPLTDIKERGRCFDDAELTLCHTIVYRFGRKDSPLWISDGTTTGWRPRGDLSGEGARMALALPVAA